MTMIENHLREITLSANTIAELPFPAPKVFTNALLQNHHITALIRDTEHHERALFSVTPLEPGPFEPTSRRGTAYNVNGEGSHPGAYNGPKPNTAVGRILGGDLLQRIRRVDREEGRDKADVDVEVLLQGAEKLCRVYPIPGALDKIGSLRSRYQQLSASIALYETRLAKQATRLERLNQSKDAMNEEEEEEEEEEGEGFEEEHPPTERVLISAEDLEREEVELRELEEKKKGLEDRVSGMEKDLGGLLR